MSTRWAEFLLIIACVAEFFCGAAVTAASRMRLAFSRDGAVPFRRTVQGMNLKMVYDEIPAE